MNLRIVTIGTTGLIMLMTMFPFVAGICEGVVDTVAFLKNWFLTGIFPTKNILRGTIGIIGILISIPIMFFLICLPSLVSFCIAIRWRFDFYTHIAFWLSAIWSCFWLVILMLGGMFPGVRFDQGLFSIGFLGFIVLAHPLSFCTWVIAFIESQHYVKKQLSQLNPQQ